MTKQSISKILIVFILSLILPLAACSDNPGTTNVGNPSENQSNSTITIGQLSASGSATITIPLSLFGESESDLEGSSFDILVNGSVRNSNVEPSLFFKSTEKIIQFSLTLLNDGDSLDFIIRSNQGSSITLSGNVSASTEQVATTSISQNNTTLMPATLMVSMSEDSRDEFHLDASVVQNLQNDLLKVSLTSSISPLQSTTVKAQPFYNSLTHKLIFSVHDLLGRDIHGRYEELSLEITLLNENLETYNQMGLSHSELLTITALENAEEQPDFVYSLNAFTGTSLKNFSDRVYVLNAPTSTTSGDCDGFPNEQIHDNNTTLTVNANSGLLYLEFLTEEELIGNWASYFSDGSFEQRGVHVKSDYTLTYRIYGTLTDNSVTYSKSFYVKDEDTFCHMETSYSGQIN